MTNTPEPPSLNEQPCRWCFPVMLLLFVGGICLFYKEGYDTGYVAGELHQLERQIDNFERMVYP